MNFIRGQKTLSSIIFFEVFFLHNVYLITVFYRDPYFLGRKKKRFRISDDITLKSVLARLSDDAEIIKIKF